MKPCRALQSWMIPSLVLVMSVLAAPADLEAQACNNVSFVNPASPPPFLVDISQAPGTGFCQFEEFSSWNFMSLVLGDEPDFAAWPTSAQVFQSYGPPNCSNPAPLASTLTHLIAQSGGSFNTDLNDIIEATGQPLVDQNGRYAQFEIRINPTFCNIVNNCQLYTKSCISAVTSTVPNFQWFGGNTSANQAGVAELKLAWRVLETCNLPDSPKNCKPDDLDLFFWVPNVTVQPYSPKIQKAVSGVTVGLVGFHLAQKTPTHPEMIWATWEHISNAPVCPGSNNTQCQDPSAANAGVGTASGWSFFNPNVQPPSPSPTASQCTSSPPSVPNCFDQGYYDPNNVQAQPVSQICRFAPCGNNPQASNIAQLNQAIRAKLGSNVWANYFLVGTVWGNGSACPTPNSPGCPTGSGNSVGSIQLANTTMESFFQTQSFKPNCFTCHVGPPCDNDPNNCEGVVNIDFSHALVRAQQTGATCTVNFNTCQSSN